eukprot:tig00000042_g15498.t1
MEASFAASPPTPGARSRRWVESPTSETCTTPPPTLPMVRPSPRTAPKIVRRFSSSPSGPQRGASSSSSIVSPRIRHSISRGPRRAPPPPPTPEAFKATMEEVFKNMKRLQTLSFEQHLDSLKSFRIDQDVPEQLEFEECDEDDEECDICEALIVPSDDEIVPFIRSGLQSELDILGGEHVGLLESAFREVFEDELSTIRLLAALRMDPPTLAACVVRDAHRRGLVSSAQIEETLGKNVRAIVEDEAALSRLPSMVESWDDSKSALLREMCFAVTRDPRPMMLKLATRLHEMRELKRLPSWERQIVALETMQVWSVLAHGLGVGRVMWELEDLAFRELFPESYQQLESWVRGEWDCHQALLDDARERITKLLSADHEFRSHSSAYMISARAKNMYSTYKKLVRNPGYAYHDYLGLRVVLEAPGGPEEEARACYRALELVHSLWPAVPGRSKDYVARPKPNGYQSLHTTVALAPGVFLEVQLRSARMHEHAEYGFASHALYKGGLSQDPDKVQAWMDWLGSVGAENARPLLPPAPAKNATLPGSPSLHAASAALDTDAAVVA